MKYEKDHTASVSVLNSANQSRFRKTQPGKKQFLTPYTVAVSIILLLITAASLFVLTIPVEADYNRGRVETEIRKYEEYKRKLEEDIHSGTLKKTPHVKSAFNIYSAFLFKDTDVNATRRKELDAENAVPFFFVNESSKMERFAKFNSYLRKYVLERLDANPEIEIAPELHEFENADDRLAFDTVAKLSTSATAVLGGNFRDPVTDESEEALKLAGQGIADPAAGASQNKIFIDSLGRERPYESLRNRADAIKYFTGDILFHGADVPQADITALANALTKILERGTVVQDTAIRNKRLAEARANVTPEEKLYPTGSLLIAKGNTLDDANTALLKSYVSALDGRQRALISWQTFLTNAALCIVIMIFISVYVYHIHPEIAESVRAIALLGAIVIVGLVLNRILGNLFYDLTRQESVMPQLIALSLPLAFASLITSVIFGLRAALCAGIFVSAITAIALGNSFSVFITGVVTSCMGGFAVRKTTDYKRFFMYAFLSCGICIFVMGGIFISKNTIPLPGMTQNTISKTPETVSPEDENRMVLVPEFVEDPLAFDTELLKSLASVTIFSGVISAILALVGLFVIESILHVSTNMTYLLYTDRNHPLLKRLQLEAPGTSHHSECVASLAEKAASVIGGNPLKAQVCGLFHDVGKLGNPILFTENSDGRDISSMYGEKEFAGMIKSHITEGMALARKYRLTLPIRSAIRRHHGTDFISFLYAKAKDKGLDVNEKDFRYEGPLPADKEIVIVSLADCCEAAVRSIEEPTEEKIREKVSEIFLAKLRNNQLAAAEITLEEFYKIRESFISTLVMMNHTRIAYGQFGDNPKS